MTGPAGRGQTRRRRKQAHARGHAAEAAAAWLLRLKGYRIVARRVRTPLGEIDLIAARGPVTAFVEVKQRRSHDDALAAVNPHQARRIVSAARIWLSKNPGTLTGDCRFDIVTVSTYLWPKHTPNAFDADVF